MLDRLRAGPATISQLAEPLPMSFVGASKHVQVLEQAGLIQREVQGREHYCRLETTSLAQAADWLAYYRGFWDVRLDALERHVTSRRKPTFRRRSPP